MSSDILLKPTRQPLERTACLGIFGRLFGHNFEPRYDSVPVSDGAKALEHLLPAISEVLRVSLQLSTTDTPDALESVCSTFRNDACSEIYVHDVCTRCGQVRAAVRQRKLG